MPITRFSHQLSNAFQEKNSRICVGLDPRLEWLPAPLLDTAIKNHGKTLLAAGQAITEFNKQVIDAVLPYAVAVKPQFAFYEQYGVPGIQALQDTIAYAKKQNLLIIADAKRGDIGSTAEAYSNSLIGKTNVFETPTSIFDTDAVTVNPYLGEDSLEPFITDSKKFGKGIFVLVKTSNPGSKDFQDITSPQGTVSEHVARLVAKFAQPPTKNEPYSDVGAVVGATFPEEAKKLRQLMPHSIFLVPGIGAQGGDINAIAPFFNDDTLGAVVNSSRGIIFSYRDTGEKDYKKSISQAVKTLQKDINQEIGI